MDGTSHSIELLLSVDRDGPHTLGAQIEEQLRSAIRSGALRPGTEIPSTRDLARQLGISRRVAVEAYAQLAAEGYLAVRQGARPRVAAAASAYAPHGTGTAGRAAAGGGATSGGAATSRGGATSDGAATSRGGATSDGAATSRGGATSGGAATSGDRTTAGGVPDVAPPGSPAGPSLGRVPRFDFRPSVPDVSAFPRVAWLKSLRKAMSAVTDAELGYGDPNGDDVLKSQLADYLGRVRGVVAQPSRVVVTNGYGQAQGLVCQALRAQGATRIALEHPSNTEQREIARRAGLEPVLVPVDERGLRVDELPDDVDAVILTPAHQHPTGVVLAAERRTQLLGWLREHEGLAIEDDYDAEYRYDRAAVGALQGLEPERIVYAGSASKTLAPALRLGWLVVPHHLVEPIRREKYLADQGTARVEQHAFADFIARGELDRHLRRMRSRYRVRRDTLVAALQRELPEARVKGIAAGLHVTVELPDGHDERAIKSTAEAARIRFNVLGDYDATGPPTLMLGYGALPESAIDAGVRELAGLIRQHRPARDV